MILIFPVLLKKYLLYGDPIAPFLSNILNVDLEYKNLLKTISNQGWKAEGFKLFELTQFFIPWKIILFVCLPLELVFYMSFIQKYI